MYYDISEEYIQDIFCYWNLRVIVMMCTLIVVILWEEKYFLLYESTFPYDSCLFYESTLPYVYDIIEGTQELVVTTNAQLAYSLEVFLFLDTH